MARKENPIPAGNPEALPLGARMRMARQAGGLTLGEVAGELGYSKAHLSAVENRTVRPSRELVAGYERVLAIADGRLLAAYDREAVRAAEKERPARATIAARSPAVTWDGQPGGLSLDGELARVLEDAGLAVEEADLVRQMLLEDARVKAAQVIATVDWWRTPGPVPVCCIPIAGWQWREWTRDRIVAALDRAAAEAMKARIRELVVILPPAEIAGMHAAFAGASFAQRMQRLSCVPQSEALGLGHAILQARPQIGERPFAVLLPDNHFDRPGAETAVLQQLAENYAEGGSSVLAVGKLKINRRNYGLARLWPAPNEYGLRPIELVAEKPDARHPISCSEPPCDPDAVRTVLGRYVLSPTVLTALSALDRERLPGQSLELADALQWLIDRRREEIVGWELPSLVQLGRDDTVFVATYPMMRPKDEKASGGRRRSSAVA
jgi:UTP-glucose-1-phosphate uridylyltransferase/transcriptional regulator with XRE-family HTH domain